jgi:GSH-dependent disulfide-bond oxidoreductase
MVGSYPQTQGTTLRSPHEFPSVKRWLEEIGERPAVKKAMAMGPEFREDTASISAEEQARRRKLVADQRAQPIPSEWVRAA